MATNVTLKGQILGFMCDAMHENFADGQSVAYDASSVKVLAPPAYNGKILAIYHDQLVPPDSLWRAVNQWVQFEIDQEWLEKGLVLFAGAISRLRSARVNGERS